MNRVGLLEIDVIDFEKEFKISLQIKQDNKLINEPINARLSSNSQIPILYQEWSDYYESLKKKLQEFRDDDFEFEFDDLTENIENTNQVINDEIVSLKQSLNRTLIALKESLKTWFQSEDESLLKIKQKINEELQQSNDFQVLLKTQDELLCKLPWQLENFLEIPNRKSLEVGLAFPEQQQITKITASKKKDKVRVLVVLGNSKGINAQRDKELLERCDDVEAVFLNQPTDIEFVKRLRDEKGWDIFLFSGHSKTKQQEGRIYINQNSYLTISDFKNSLEVAIKQGLKLMIFNSCDGLGLAFDLAKTRLLLPVMLIMKEPIPDVVAQAFLQEFLNEYSTVQYSNNININEANISQDLYTSVSKVRVYLQQYWETEFPGVSALPLIFQNPAFSPPIWQEFISEVKVKRLLESMEQNIGFETIETARKLDVWGVYFRDDLPQYNQAQFLFEKALEIRQKLLGNEHLAIAESLENIAKNCDAQERFAEAELKYQKALEIRQKLLGDNHLDVASSLYKLGCHYHARKRYNEASELYNQALEMSQRLGDTWDNISAIQRSIIALNIVINQAQKTNESDSKYLQILENYLQILDNSHNQVQDSFEKFLTKEKITFVDRIGLFYLSILKNNLKLVDNVFVYVVYSLTSLANQDVYTRAKNVFNLVKPLLVIITNSIVKASFLKVLADLSLTSGNDRQAERLYKKALKIYQKFQGENDTSVAEICDKLGYLYCQKKQYKQAEKSYRQSLEIQISLFSESHISVANTLINLAQAYNEQKLYDQAKSNLIKALEIKKNKLDNNHLEIAEILSKLANVYQIQKDFDQAEAFYLESLEIRKKLQQNEQILDILVTIGDFYNSFEYYNKAESYYLQVLDIWKNYHQLFDFKNQSIEQQCVTLSKLVTILNNLSGLMTIYVSQNMIDQAESLIVKITEAIEIIEDIQKSRLTNQNNSAILSQVWEQFLLSKVPTYFLIGAIYYYQQKYSESNFYTIQALELAQQLYKNDFFSIKSQNLKQVISSLIQLITLPYTTGLYFSRNEIEHIDIEILLKGLEITKRCLGEKHEFVVTTLWSLAIVYQTKNQYQEAENYCLQALNLLKGFFQRNNTNQINILNQLAMVYQEQSRFKEAESLYNESNKIVQRLCGKESLEMAINLNNLGTLYRDQELYDQAESYLTQALELQKRLEQDNNTDFARSLDNLGMVYFGQKRYKEAESLYLQALEIFERDLKNDDPRIIRCRKNIEEVTNFIG